MFSIKLKELREKEELSQQELANILKLSQSTVATWESSKKEPVIITRLKKIATIFNTSIDCLVEFNTKNKSYNFTTQQKEIIELILQLTELQTMKVYGYLLGLLEKDIETKESIYKK